MKSPGFMGTRSGESSDGDTRRSDSDRSKMYLKVQGGNSIGFLDRLTDRLKMGDGLKMSDFGLGMS